MTNDHPASHRPGNAVSVIIPTHNRPSLLQEALASVLGQTLLPAEILIVDDASDPPAALPANSNGIPLRLLRHERQRGGAAAKNTGAQAAQGEVIAFLDDDDLWAPTYLEQATTLLARHRDIDVLFMGVEWFGRHADSGRQAYQQAMSRVLSEADGEPLGPGELGFGRPLVKALLKRVPMAFQRPVVRHSAFLRIGAYQEDCLLWDCDWALRAALDGKTALSEAPLYMQRLDAQGYSSRPAREREQTLSNIEIRERLAARLTANDAATRALRRDFRRSAGQNWFYLAYQLQRQGESLAAFKAWMASLRITPQAGSTRLLLRILFRLRKPSR